MRVNLDVFSDFPLQHFVGSRQIRRALQDYSLQPLVRLLQFVEMRLLRFFARQIFLDEHVAGLGKLFLEAPEVEIKQHEQHAAAEENRRADGRAQDAISLRGTGDVEQKTPAAYHPVVDVPDLPNL